MRKPRQAVVPAGIELADDEAIIKSARDWGASIPLLLTTRRLVCPLDPSRAELAAIPLGEIRNVALRKPPLGFATVTVDYGEERKAKFPVHVNANRIVADILDAVERARQSGEASGDRGRDTGDRFEQLRKLGDLRASGVLTETEFEAEKARILRRQ